MTRQLWPLLIGFTIWAIAFVVLYAAQALGCTWGWPEPLHRLVLVATWLATMGVFTVLLARQWKSSSLGEGGISRAGFVATTVAAAASIITYFPVAFASLCT